MVEKISILVASLLATPTVVVLILDCSYITIENVSVAWLGILELAFVLLTLIRLQ